MHELVFICGPYRANTINSVFENIYRARQEAAKWWARGYYVFCPHMNTSFMDGIVDDEMFLSFGLYMLGFCDRIVLLPGWSGSKGALAECNRAKKLNIRITLAEGAEGVQSLRDK